MQNAATILDSEKESFARVMTMEMGKTFRSAVDEAAKCAWVCRYYAENAERFLVEEVVETGARRSDIHYQPLGPILAVMPWNFPFWQVMRFAAPALMAGNVGLLKHASIVPQSALLIEELFRRAGFPDEAFQTLLVSSREVDKILADPPVMAATLTCSEQAGIEVGIGAAKRIKKVVQELGGSDLFIAMPSANLETATSTAVKARIFNSGQSCIAAKRSIVDESIAKKFGQLFAQKMAALRVGDPLDELSELGPLSTSESVADLDRDVRKTVEDGAKILTGGKSLDRPGNLCAPTGLVNVPKDSPGSKEELFGPVACVFSVRDVEDVIRIANDSRFGLGASAWSNDSTEQQKFIDGLDAGMVFINRMAASDPRNSFGGVKWSGHARELGAIGIKEFTNLKAVWVEQR
jgi:succinate-semialdehyde dehydrogenase / glutarate-semialdehyde dehydrogenase